MCQRNLFYWPSTNLVWRLALSLWNGYLGLKAIRQLGGSNLSTIEIPPCGNPMLMDLPRISISHQRRGKWRSRNSLLILTTNFEWKQSMIKDQVLGVTIHALSILTKKVRFVKVFHIYLLCRIQSGHLLYLLVGCKKMLKDYIGLIFFDRATADLGVGK